MWIWLYISMSNQSYAWNLENMIPWDVEKQKKQTKKDTDAPKEDPESFQDERCDQRDPEEASRRAPKAPEAPQRPTRAEKYEKPTGF